MFQTLFWSLRKSARLQDIAKKLTPKPDGGDSLTRRFAEGGFDGITPRLKEVEEGKKELFSLLRDDPSTSKMLDNFGISDDNLNELYDKLVRNGAGIYKNGHWIPASSLAFGQTLDYVLRHRDDHNVQFRKVRYRVWQYFSANETGEIEE